MLPGPPLQPFRASYDAGMDSDGQNSTIEQSPVYVCNHRADVAAGARIRSGRRAVKKMVRKGKISLPLVRRRPLRLVGLPSAVWLAIGWVLDRLEVLDDRLAARASKEDQPHDPSRRVTQPPRKE